MRLSTKRSSNRPGVVLLGVLVVIVILALIAYQYSDRMVAEYQAANNAHRAAQARHFADSGIHYAAMMLSNPDNIANRLGGNPYDNPDKFKNVLINDSENLGQAGRFTLVAPVDPDQSSSGDYRAGVTDESGKININALMKRDSTGDQLYNMLMKLPNMTDPLAASIVRWVDPNKQVREGAADDDYYSGLNPPYRCKSGPLDSLDELLLVKGMTRELLYGADLNHNGIADGDELAFGASTDRGLAAFLTVTSREPNRDPTGQAYVNLNADDLSALAEGLAQKLDGDMIKYLILYRQYGPTASTGGQQNIISSLAALAGVGPNRAMTANTVQGSLSDFTPNLTKKGSVKVQSFFDLVGTTVTVMATQRGQKSTVYTCPMTDVNKSADILAQLYTIASLNDDAEIPARINVNTAPREVLACIDGLTDADVQTIIASRPRWSTLETPSPEFQTPVWLATHVGLKTQTLRNLEKVVTTKTSVFNVQSIGQFDNGKGPTARVEAIIDANFGRPRIVYYRDWSELGKTKLPQ